MKKILSFTLTILIFMSLCGFSAFAVERTVLSQKFYDYCEEVMPEDIKSAGEREVYILDKAEVDGITYFSARAWNNVEYSGVYKKFGDTNVYSTEVYMPYDLGIYAASGDEIYTLEEAYNMGLITDVSLLANSFEYYRYTFYEDYVPNPENKYESQVVQKVFRPSEWAGPYFSFSYQEMYEYYSGGNASLDEATPDYVLIYLCDNIVMPMLTCDVFGDYILQASSMYSPFTYRYGIYIPETGEVFSLEKAYEKGIEGIDKVFTEFGIGRLLGDMDNDGKLTVKDATYIQKALAGFDGFADTSIYGWQYKDDMPCSMADVNRDRTANTKDATAIQKYIAGITE
ncbi:MAG: hypothetical protein E7566_03605 [Ruminococcaceae bacterium]|nr:hypothetical protein [Oscillospiraceae bacterium]